MWGDAGLNGHGAGAESFCPTILALLCSACKGGGRIYLHAAVRMSLLLYKHDAAHQMERYLRRELRWLSRMVFACLKNAVTQKQTPQNVRRVPNARLSSLRKLCRAGKVAGMFEALIYIVPLKEGEACTFFNSLKINNIFCELDENFA